MRASRIASGIWLACCCLASTYAQVEASLMVGAGMSYGTVSGFELCGLPRLSTGGSGGAGGSLHAGFDIGSAPYAGWGWRLSAEVSSRYEDQAADFEQGACGVTEVGFETEGAFVDLTASAIYIREDWWGASGGGGVSGYVVPGAERVGFFAPVAQVGVFRVLESVTLGADCSLGFTRLGTDDFEVQGNPEATVVGEWWFATPRVRISVPFGRSAWIRSLRYRTPVGNPRG